MVTGIIMTVVFDNFVCQYILRTLTNSVVYVTQCEKPNQAYICTQENWLDFKKNCKKIRVCTAQFQHLCSFQ